MEANALTVYNMSSALSANVTPPENPVLGYEIGQIGKGSFVFLEVIITAAQFKDLHDLGELDRTGFTLSNLDGEFSRFLLDVPRLARKRAERLTAVFVGMGLGQLHPVQ